MSARRYEAAGILIPLVLGASLSLAGGPRLGVTEFPHDVHVEGEGLSCSDCHGEGAGADETPTTASPEVCADCHEPEDVARFFPAGSYHPADWRHAHAAEVRFGGSDCATCHRGSETCVACHEGENIDFLAHPRNWRFSHAVEARHAQTDCRSCHAVESFCTDCHAAERVQPGSHRMAGWTRGPVHGAEARRDVESCAACHGQAEPVCADCHTLGH
jgi:hypothetical protein